MKTPKKIFTNKKEYEDRKKEMYNKLKNAIDDWVNDEGHNVCWDSDTIWTDGVYHTLEKCLIDFTDNKEWSETTSENIIRGIEGFLNGLDNTIGVFKNKQSFTSEKLSEIIYSSIIWQLDDGTHSPCILEDIPQYNSNCEMNN